MKRGQRNSGAVLIGILIGLLIRWFRSGTYVTSSGYMRRRPVFGNSRYEHREIAEKILGRRLEEWEVVHHINGRRRDNRLENLCVMDQTEHDRYHEWYDWIVETYGNYPRRETQLRKLREDFDGKLLVDFREIKIRSNIQSAFAKH